MSAVVVPEVGAVPVLTRDEAIAVATEIAAELAATSLERDRDRVLPRRELDRLSTSGLLAVTVPTEHGGAGLPVETLAEVFRILATGDPSVAQVPHSHFVYVNALVEQGSDEQIRFLLG